MAATALARLEALRRHLDAEPGPLALAPTSASRARRLHLRG